MTKKHLFVYLLYILVGFLGSVIVAWAWTNPSAAPPSGDPGPVPVSRGGTTATTTSAARSNLGAAASGANSDITSLSGLTTALTTSQGGIGTALTISKGDLLVGINSGGAFTRLATSTNGYRLTASSTATHGLSWEAVSTAEGGGWTDDGTVVRLTTITDSVGIGTTTPATSLQVQGNITILSGSDIRPSANSTAAINIANSAGTDFVVFDTSNSRVGIGVTPGYKLDVVSGGATTARFGTAGDTVLVGGTSAATLDVGAGAGKINAGTVDPIYTIGGERYATYLPAMTGVKEETTGVAEVKCQNSNVKCEYAIDFSKAEKGSDIWLFYQITDFGKDWENLTVLLSPSFDGRVWYKKYPSDGKLIIYGDKDGEVSYRLTAPRFDHSTWSNIVSDESVQGFIVPLK